jgi:GDP/UDP-N,N'-diacetylbacillosamine 2-epimerase (hydrolysing)
MSRRVCVVTGSRAEYGLLRLLMEAIRKSPTLELQVVATGMHLSPEFGLTYRAIEEDGFRIDRKVEMLLSSDTPSGVAKSMGLGLIGFGDVLEQLHPDLVVVLGDRFEILAAATAAVVARIPIAHIHGGETTEGAFDDAIRHSLTKMSHLHFVANDEYRRRVIQLGEQPERVFTVGGLGIDAIGNLQLLDRAAVEKALELDFGKKNLLVTFHPVTLEASTSAQQMTELLAALSALRDTNLVFTMPNADTDGRQLFGMIRDFVAAHRNARAYTSLGQLLYLSCLKEVDGVVGNSSSGLIEAPSLKKGTVNIGDRQKGRLRAASVIDCKPERTSIASAIAKLYSAEFQGGLASVDNPYGNAGASGRIVRIIEEGSLEGILKKRFYDTPATAVAQGLKR